MGTESPPLPDVKQEIGDRVGEAKRVIKRLADIVEDHRKAAVSLNVKLGPDELRSVLKSLRDHEWWRWFAGFCGSRRNPWLLPKSSF